MIALHFTSHKRLGIVLVLCAGYLSMNFPGKHSDQLLSCNNCVKSSKSAVDEEQWGVLLCLYRENCEPCPQTPQSSQKNYQLGKVWSVQEFFLDISAFKDEDTPVPQNIRIQVSNDSIISQKTGILLYVFLPSWMAVPCPVMSQCYWCSVFTMRV